GIAATPGTVYRIGSVTKTFVALGIMHLVHEGKLDLDDPLSVIVPELPVRNRWEESHPVLLRHLLEHTAGFRDLYLRDFMIPEGTPLPAMEDAVMRQPRYWVSRWWPGTRSAYANPGYTLLGYIIEKYSGMPYNEYLEEILLHPLGMENSDFLGRNSDSLALSYDSSGNPQAPLPIMDHPAGYLHTTPEDMARFIHFMLLRGAAGRVGDGTGVANQPGAGSGATDQPVDSPDGTGQERGTVPDEREGDPSWQSGSEYGRPWFMPEEMFRLMERPSSIAGAGNEMLGYGMGLHSMVVNGNVGAGHDGGIDEYLSSFVSFHVAGSAYYFTITSMNPQGASAIAGYLQEILLDEITPVSDNIADQPAEIEGWYRIRSYRLALARILHDLFDPVKLQVVNDTLRMGGFSGQTTNLISLGGGYYRTEDSPLPTHWIGLHGGRPVISSSFGQSGGYYEQTNAFRALGKTWALLISFNLFFLTALIYFVNYLVVRFRKRDINSAPMVWPALGVLCLVLMVFVFSGMTSIYLLASPNTRSVAVAIFSALFAICLVMGLLSLRRGVTHVKTWKRVPLYAGYVAWIYIVVLLASYGHMPLTTWIW
ncbi:MAG: hypothetical protein EA408_00210, partial [Marinilabiliales bacterium]